MINHVFFFLANFQPTSRIFGQPAAKFWAQAVGFGQLVIGGPVLAEEPLRRGTWPDLFGMDLGDMSESRELQNIASGYVKIAIEIGHRNSGFTH